MRAREVEARRRRLLGGGDREHGDQNGAEPTQGRHVHGNLAGHSTRTDIQDEKSLAR